MRKIDVVLMIVFIIVFTYSIVKSQMVLRKIKKMEFYRADNKINGETILGLVIFVYFLLACVRTKQSITKLYDLLKKDYLSSIYQLFDFSYLKYMAQYFIENEMYVHSVQTNLLRNEMIKNLSIIILFLPMSILYIYRGWNKNIVYEDGILYHDRLYKCAKIKGLKWSESYDKKYFCKGKYYNLMVSLPKLYDLDMQLKLRIKYDDKEKVDHILNKYYNL